MCSSKHSRYGVMGEVLKLKLWRSRSPLFPSTSNGQNGWKAPGKPGLETSPSATPEQRPPCLDAILPLSVAKNHRGWVVSMKTISSDHINETWVGKRHAYSHRARIFNLSSSFQNGAAEASDPTFTLVSQRS